MPRPADLPEFENPPVAEVAMSIQFDSLSGPRADGSNGIRHVDLGDIWARFKEHFPNLSEHPPIPEEFEIFGNPGIQYGRPALMPSFRFMHAPEMPRLWFESISKSEVIQIQWNRLLYNWRRQETGTSYPRYERLRNSFLGAAKTFESFLLERNFPDLVINQCELTYVNHIVVPDDEPDLLALVFKFWQNPESQNLGIQEDAAFNIRYIFRHEDGEPFARLTVSSFKGLDPQGKSVIHFGLTVRGRPILPNLDSALGFFDFARGKIVHGFDELTTPKMHTAWGKVATK